MKRIVRPLSSFAYSRLTAIWLRASCWLATVLGARLNVEALSRVEAPIPKPRGFLQGLKPALLRTETWGLKPPPPKEKAKGQTRVPRVAAKAVP